jgi:demethylmenaquinone methyltransferase / 2-methoxy-6-polyprenyl-1,4-benzoquinol methylase
VCAMFDEIAPRYDRLNHLLSAGFDHGWRRAAVGEVFERTEVSPLRVLDVCCGTGDLAREFGRSGRVAEVIGVDFSAPMLLRARRKYAADRKLGWVRADALQLPVAPHSVDVVSIGFGLRNLVDPVFGIQELAARLRSGGILVVLEFFRPVDRWLSGAFQWYLRNVLPRVGRWLSGATQADAYQYLPDSVVQFAGTGQVCEWMQAAGLREPRAKWLCAGTVGLVSGVA